MTYNPSGVKVCFGLFSGVATGDDSRPGSGWKKRRKKTVKMEGNVGERGAVSECEDGGVYIMEAYNNNSIHRRSPYDPPSNEL